MKQRHDHGHAGKELTMGALQGGRDPELRLVNISTLCEYILLFGGNGNVLSKRRDLNPCSGFQRGGIVGVRTLIYLAFYWPTH